MCSGKRIRAATTWISIRHVGFLQTDPLDECLTAIILSAEATRPDPMGRAAWLPDQSFPYDDKYPGACSGNGRSSFDRCTRHKGDGGARRSRTDDLLNANQALSQLSYGPVTPASRQVACPALRCRRLRWWAEEELNFRPHAYQACALTT